MSASEAREEYLKGNDFEEVNDYNTMDDNLLRPCVVVKTKIHQTRSYNGRNRRISSIHHNRIKSVMKQTVIGTESFTVKVSLSVGASQLVDSINISGA